MQAAARIPGQVVEVVVGPGPARPPASSAWSPAKARVGRRSPASRGSPFQLRRFESARRRSAVPDAPPGPDARRAYLLDQLDDLKSEAIRDFEEGGSGGAYSPESSSWSMTSGAAWPRGAGRRSSRRPTSTPICERRSLRSRASLTRRHTALQETAAGPSWPLVVRQRVPRSVQPERSLGLPGVPPWFDFAFGRSRYETLKR
jgi:hypothetical protein